MSKNTVPIGFLLRRHRQAVRSLLPPLLPTYPPTEVTLYQKRHDSLLWIFIEIHQRPPAHALRPVGFPPEGPCIAPAELVDEPARHPRVHPLDTEAEARPAKAARDGRRRREREGCCGEIGDCERGHRGIVGRREEDRSRECGLLWDGEERGDVVPVVGVGVRLGSQDRLRYDEA